MLSPTGEFLGGPSTPALDSLKGVLNRISEILWNYLPHGCPFVIGGGIVRDGIMGGRPNDIDIWLPSDFGIRNCTSFCGMIHRELSEHATVIFSGPETIYEANASEYRDMSNHWVVEFPFRGFRINIMRTMTPWTGSQQFFDSIMQNFDIDLCMMFMGFDYNTCGNLWATPVTHAILPRNIVESMSQETAILGFNWNRFRSDQASEARMTGRRNKMMARYNVLEGTVLPQATFEATPVPLSFLANNLDLLPLPAILEERPTVNQVQFGDAQYVTSAQLTALLEQRRVQEAMQAAMQQQAFLAHQADQRWDEMLYDIDTIIPRRNPLQN